MQRSATTRVAVQLAVLAVAVELCISANLLTWAGVPYVSDGGSLLVKLHPGTDLLFAAFAVLLAGGGGWSLLAGDRFLAGFLGGMAACLVYAFVMTGSGNLIVLLDTFLPAGLLALILCNATPTQLASLRRAMQLLLVINATIALLEVVLQATLIPLYLNDAAYQPHASDFRPTALFDHPLTGAAITMMGLTLCPERGWARWVYGAVLWAALVAFGGRVALAASIVSALVAGGVETCRLLLLRDKLAIHMLLAGAAVLLAGIPLVGVALSMGLGTRIAAHLYWDDSAQVRLAQWQLLDQLDGWQMLFGTQRSDLLALLNPLRLGSGVEVIENFWLLMFASFGAIGFPLFVGSLLALLLWCWRRVVLRGRLLVIAVMLVASTSNSLGRKSTILVCLVATVACLRHRHSVAALGKRTDPVAMTRSWAVTA